MATVSADILSNHEHLPLVEEDFWCFVWKENPTFDVKSASASFLF